MKENKENKVLTKIESKALEDKLEGRSYDLTDFSFSFKTAPALKDEFKEIEAKFLYKEKPMTYYCFVRKEFNDQEAIKAAQEKIKDLIRTGEITAYAKYCYKLFY